MNAYEDPRGPNVPIVATSRGRGWGDVIVDLIETDTPPSGRETHFFSPEHHVVGLAIDGAFEFVQDRNGTETRGVKTPGSITFRPVGDTGSSWTRGRHTAAGVWIPASFVASLAEHTFANATIRELAPVYDSRDPVIVTLITMLVNELRTPAHPAQKLVYDSTSYALAAQLLRAFSVAPSIAEKLPSTLPPATLKATLAYIDENLANAIGLDDLALAANVSRFHFARLFKGSTGISPMTYLERSRIRYAEKLLREGELPLKAVASAVGFADQSHFTHRFRLATGFTPAVYRKHAARPYFSSAV